MREILFRGKRTDNGEWVDGYYCRAFRWAGDKDPQPAIQENDWFMFRTVDPDTVGQYTGLTDKNGKRIFEGDICTTGLRRPYAIVVFREGCFEYELDDGDGPFFDIMAPISSKGKEVTEDKFTEVIGNIHDNPELLGGNVRFMFPWNQCESGNDLKERWNRRADNV